VEDSVKKVAFYTLGCKVNQYETEAMAEAFENAGYELVDFDGFADVYVINTCTVTSLSSRKSRQAIRKARQMNDQAVVAAVGCYPQTAKEEVEKLSEVDIVAGTSERGRLPEYVEAFRAGKGRITEVGNIMKKRTFENLNIERYKGRTRAFLKVQEGCSQFCAYCIIPYARGPICSRPPEEVVEEVKRLAAAGFREVVLTGIHLASYGKDLGGMTLMELVKRVHEEEGIDRIRLGSIEPTLLTREFVVEAAGLKKLCPHYHVSLQSGCDETLARMNRRYTTAEYREAVTLLRQYMPDVSVTTDVMVGFPGENDLEFSKTYEFLSEIRFAKMHVFKYSPRKGTPAASMEDQVDGSVKEKRSELVLQLSERCALEFHARYEGYTENYIRVLTKGNPTLIGMIEKTLLTKCENDYIIGEIKHMDV